MDGSPYRGHEIWASCIIPSLRYITVWSICCAIGNLERFFFLSDNLYRTIWSDPSQLTRHRRRILIEEALGLVSPSGTERNTEKSCQPVSMDYWHMTAADHVCIYLWPHFDRKMGPTRDPDLNRTADGPDDMLGPGFVGRWFLCRKFCLRGLSVTNEPDQDQTVSEIPVASAGLGSLIWAH